MKQKKSRVLVFLLTGSNYELSRSEVISVLNAENVNFKILPSSSFIVRAKILKCSFSRDSARRHICPWHIIKGN